MAAPPPLFDPNIAQLRLERSLKAGPVTFLHDEAASMVEERLQEVNRTFPDRSIVTSFREPWVNSGISANCVPVTDTLNLDTASLDLLVHGLALHNSNDPVGQLVQCRRALREDGLLIATMFGGQTLHELRSVMAQAETEVRGGLSPRIHPMGEIRDLGGLLQRAGFALPVADGFTLTVTYQSIFHLMRDLRGMGETNMLAQQDRRFMRRDVLAKAAEVYQSAFGLPDGRIPATFELVFLTGWAPAATQQKPLRPGSAAARLSDALETKEIGLGDAIPMPPSEKSHD